jgi:nucleotide-binding universal stress UspA family protein
LFSSSTGERPTVYGVRRYTVRTDLISSPPEAPTMYEVLLGLDDDDDRAIAQARTVANLPHAADSVRATLLHVFTGNSGGASVTQVSAVRRARDHLEEAGVAVAFAEESGDPADRIVEVAGDRDVDLIAVAGRRRSPTGKAVFGSVTQDVVLEADRPVVVCHRDDA